MTKKEMLYELYRQGLTYQAIANELDMPLGTVSGWINAGIRSGAIAKRLRRKSLSLRMKGTSYKKALPPEKWPRVEHFIAAFSRCAKLSEAVGRTLDVPQFLGAYRDICQKKDDFSLL